MRDIDTIIERMRTEHPGTDVRQLKVKFPGADDDGLWFFRHPTTSVEVQIESSSGMCPFLIETDGSDDRKEVHSVEAVLDTLKTWLRLR
jgi:hypothetical protein